MARSCLREKSLPAKMWGEAVRHLVYILNRLPTKALRGETPYEAWTGTKPKLDHVKVFGCLAYVKAQNVCLGKLDDRGVAMVYIGKEPGAKAHRLYNPNMGRVHVSRDVVFDEGKGWDWTCSNGRGNDKHDTFVIIDAQTSVQENNEAESPSPWTPNSVKSSVQGNDSRSGYSSETSGNSSEPRHFRLLNDIYNETEEIEITDELLWIGVEEPTTYEQAKESEHWKEAMRVEIEQIKKNKTWMFTDLPLGRKPISLKWVYKIKKDTNGDIVKYKARLEARGYVQKKGIDYDEVFAPVTRMETVRLLLAVAAKQGWQVHHLDVKSAFLNGELMEEVYVSQPVGFENKKEVHKVYRLLKALYGLRQSSRAWYSRLNIYLWSLSFSRCPYDHDVYTKREGPECLIVAVCGRPVSDRVKQGEYCKVQETNAK